MCRVKWPGRHVARPRWCLNLLAGDALVRASAWSTLRGKRAFNSDGHHRFAPNGDHCSAQEDHYRSAQEDHYRSALDAR